MNRSKKKIGFYILIIAVIFLITAGFLKKNTTRTVTPAAFKNPDNIEVEKNAKEITVNTQQKIKFNSNDEIKQKYGRLETVSLWNGKKYTGAVLSTENIYRIVTVDGLVNIPMKDVKIREIIR